MIPLDDTVCLATGKNLATVVTLMPDGQPQALLTWVDTGDPMDWSEVRGQVVSATDGEAVGPHGRVILAIGADKINTPRLLGRCRRQRSESGTLNVSQTARQTTFASSPSASALLTVRSPRLDST